MRIVSVTLMIGTCALSACRDDNLEPDYTDFEEFFDTLNQGEVASVPGPDPYEPGEERLAFVPFYDSDGFSDTVIPGDGGAEYFIFNTEFGNQPTLEQSSVPDRIEGSTAEEFVFTGQGGFWGVSYAYMNNPQNFTRYQTLAIALLGGGDAASDEVRISMGDSDGNASVFATDFGYVNDDEWHQLFIPLSVFADGGVDLFGVTLAIELVNEFTVQNQTLLVDNLYLDEDSVEDILEDLGVAQ